MPVDPDSLTSIADVTASTATEGTITVNLGDQVTGQGYGSETSAWFPPGFYGRPADPDANGAAQALWITEGNQKRAVAFRDRRAQKLLPQVSPGESVMYGQQGQFIRTRNDGSVFVYTTDDNTVNGRGIYIKTSPTGVEINSPWARFSAGVNGIHGLTNSGARFDFGAIGGLPGGLSSLSSYAKIEAAMVSIKAGILSLGTDGGAGNEAAVTALVNILGQIIQAISLITSVTPGSTALTSALLPANGAAAVAAFTPTLAPIGKVV